MITRVEARQIVIGDFLLLDGRWYNSREMDANKWRVCGKKYDGYWVRLLIDGGVERGGMRILTRKRTTKLRIHRIFKRKPKPEESDESAWPEAPEYAPVPKTYKGILAVSRRNKPQ